MQPERSETGLLRYSVWKINKAVLWYYPAVTAIYKTPVFLIYSPINKPDILDLLPGQSTIEAFTKNGFEVYLLDFGEPGYEDRDFTLEDYIIKYIQKGVKRALRHSNAQEISLIGYCLGGTLAAIYASIAQEPIKNLILYVTPIDFETITVYDQWIKTLRTEEIQPESLIEKNELLSASQVKTGMRLLTSPVYFTPYLSLLSRADDKEYVKKWTRFNKWANSYLPLPGAFARDLVQELAKENNLIKGKLLINGKTASLKNITSSLLVISSENDALVPIEQSKPILSEVSSIDKTFVTTNRGHTGIAIKNGELPEILDMWLPERS